MSKIVHVVGLDLSLSATGVALFTHNLGVSGPKTNMRLVRTTVCSACPSDGTRTDKGERLHGIWREIVLAIGDPSPDVEFVVFAEGYSFGSKFSQQTLGEVHGVVHERVHAEYGVHVRYISPATAKKVACPRWHGWSIANWTAAGKTTKWKRSMPGKEDVLRGLWTEHKLRIATDAEGDAICVALAGAASLGISVGNITDARR